MVRAAETSAEMQRSRAWKRHPRMFVVIGYPGSPLGVAVAIPMYFANRSPFRRGTA